MKKLKIILLISMLFATCLSAQYWRRGIPTLDPTRPIPVTPVHVEYDLYKVPNPHGIYLDPVPPGHWLIEESRDLNTWYTLSTIDGGALWIANCNTNIPNVWYKFTQIPQ